MNRRLQVNDQFEHDLHDFYRGGERPDYGASSKGQSRRARHLSDSRRLDLFAALRRLNSGLSRRDIALVQYGEIGNSIAGRLMEFEGQIALMKRCLEWTPDDHHAHQAIESAHQLIGEVIMEAFASMQTDPFLEIANVIKSRLCHRDPRNVKPAQKRKGRPRTLYIMDIVFPAALKQVAFRRSWHLASDSGQKFARLKIGWEELRRAIESQQHQNGGLVYGIVFDELVERLKAAGFTEFMADNRPKRAWWDKMRANRNRSRSE